MNLIIYITQHYISPLIDHIFTELVHTQLPWALWWAWASYPNSQTTIDEGGNERSPHEWWESRGIEISPRILEKNRWSQDLPTTKPRSYTLAILLWILSSSSDYFDQQSKTTPFSIAEQRNARKRIARQRQQEMQKHRSPK